MWHSFKFTVIINPKATIQITGLPLDMTSVHPSQQIQDNELNNLLSSKFNGVLPEFYEPIQVPKYDQFLTQNKEEKKVEIKQIINKKEKEIIRTKGIRIKAAIRIGIEIIGIIINRIKEKINKIKIKKGVIIKINKIEIIETTITRTARIIRIIIMVTIQIKTKHNSPW